MADASKANGYPFVIKAREPVLVDRGMGIDSEEFMKALESIIDPKDLRWVWLTHDDADHTGSADSPWVHMAEPSKFSQALHRIRQIAPKMIFSANNPHFLHLARLLIRRYYYFESFHRLLLCRCSANCC
ncbi:MAG: MBL fold metallo-hydrolase [Nitrospiraceae bacterium]|nr:MAG: MBL fold metallo-hydrolase [Nitrospiraceae bacterium]